MKRIILCADDYGLNASVSQGIIELLRHGRLSAVSCMTTSPHWSLYSSLLKPLRDKGDVGLHFNLTEGKPLSPEYIKRYGNQFFSLSQLILRSYFHLLDGDVIERECEAQLNRFVEELGFLPDFIDGHQHIHQLPVIRKRVVAVHQRYLKNKNAYIRSVYKKTAAFSVSNQIKQLIIHLCGARGLYKLLKRYNIAHNSTFSGIYLFPYSIEYKSFFPRYLESAHDLGLIMCHPGLLNNELEPDAIQEARFNEYSYLASKQFVEDCEEKGVSLVKGVDSLYFSGTM
ncbi:MAG TPA: ChbG/HpnK family deacetylase [Gammaproteobacteria bacterium]|nr:ChbG/HpnK family deacetylase [Gammaproteobacteria bacterium]